MEDQGRGMAGTGAEQPLRPDKGQPASKRWTIMIMGRVGKVRSFKVSPRILFWGVVFLVVYFPLSIVVFNRWVDLQRENEALMMRIAELDSDLARTERSLLQSQERVTLLLDGRNDSPGSEMWLPETVASPDLTEQQSEEAPDPETRLPTPEVLSGLVDIERMSIARERTRTNVSFNLVNIAGGGETVSGYVHILAYVDRGEETWWAAYPRGEVESGLPVDFDVGQPFIIQRFRPIRGSFDDRDGVGGPESILVVVYDDSGRLIYYDSYDVKDHS